MHLMVIGATGDVGYGVVAQSLRRDWTTTAVGRRPEALQRLSESVAESTAPLDTVSASVTNSADLTRLRDMIAQAPDASVVVTISQPWPATPAEELSRAALAEYFDAYLGAHLVTAQTLIPALRPGATYLGIGGGMADFVPTGLIPTSMAQAAQRMLFTGLHKAYRSTGVQVRELLVVSPVAGHSNREHADPTWLTDTDIGVRVCDIAARPDNFAGPIHYLKQGLKP
jgi:NAD(P)-dependent dehydrogenase (short-subunit alcohol dehydrogenase family)